MRRVVDLNFVKAHAYGNDFVFAELNECEALDLAMVSRSACDRTRGIGADGMIFFQLTESRAEMKLFNADGSYAELSGNGLRCLGAVIAEARCNGEGGKGDEIIIQTDAGEKTLELLDNSDHRYTFRAAMGEPVGLRQKQLDVNGERVPVIVLSVGNPQCIVLTADLNEARFRRLGPLLATHKEFPAGTNVAFVHVESCDCAKVLIWERGVGPTEASGTGACASAVAAAAYGGSSRNLEVISPGGSQRVDWQENGIFLTGWAQITVRGRWSFSTDWVP